MNKLTLQGFPQEYLDRLTKVVSSSVGEYLQQYPVYTLKREEEKTFAGTLLLKKIEVKNSELHVTLGL